MVNSHAGGGVNKEVIASHNEFECVGGGSISDDRISTALIAELVRLVQLFSIVVRTRDACLSTFAIHMTLDPDEQISRYNDTLTNNDTLNAMRLIAICDPFELLVLQVKWIGRVEM